MKKKIKYLAIAFLIGAISLVAQEEEYNLVFDKGETINQIKQTDKYLSVRTYSNATDLYNAYLFDSNGKKLLTINDRLTYIMKLSEPIDHLGLFIVVNQGEEGYQNYEGTDDIVRAFEISTGKEKWRTNSNAMYYEISPDRNYILTKSRSSNGRKSRLEIINLSNGSKIVPELKLGSYYATWYDEENILLVNRMVELTQDYLIYQKNIYDLQEKNHYEKKALMKTFQAGNLQEDEYEKQLNALLVKRKALEKEKQQLIKRKKLSTNQMDLLKYNFKTNEILNKKELVDNNGDFILPALDESYGIVSANKKGEIFIVGRKGKRQKGNSEKKRKNYIIKLNKNLEKQWISKLLDVKDFQKINIDENVVFKTSDAFIDNDNGNTLTINEFQKRYNLTTKTSEIPNYKNKTINIYRNLSVNKNNDSMSVIKEAK